MREMRDVDFSGWWIRVLNSILIKFRLFEFFKNYLTWTVE